MLTAVRGQLSLAVRRLPAEPQVAGAELRGLLERLADGDRSAFAPAFAILWPALRAFALRYAGPLDGEDAAQAALLRIFARAGEYDSGRDAFAWALGIAAWECRTARRKRQRRKEEAGAHFPSEQADPRPGPEEEAIDRDLRAAAEAILGTLRPADVETIAALAGGPRRVEGATFRKRVQRAIGRFRLAWRARHGSE